MQNIFKSRFNIMSNELLLYLCQVTILFAVIVGAVSAFGAFHYSQQVQKERDANAEAKEKNAVVPAKENIETIRSRITNLEAINTSGHGIYSDGVEIDAKNIKIKGAGGDAVHLEATKPTPLVKPSDLPK